MSISIQCDSRFKVGKYGIGWVYAVALAMLVGCTKESPPPPPPAMELTADIAQPEPFEATDSEGHLVSRGFRLRRDDGNYLRVGEWTYYFPNGSIKETGEYENDTRSGLWSFYAIHSGYNKYLDKGEHYLSHQERFENGETVYRIVYSYRPRRKSFEGAKKDGKMHGWVYSYDEDGNTASESLYDLGSMVGWRLRNSSGEVAAEFAQGVYTLRGIEQDQQSIPKTLDSSGRINHDYCENALRHASEALDTKQ